MDTFGIGAREDLKGYEFKEVIREDRKREIHNRGYSVQEMSGECTRDMKDPRAGTPMNVKLEEVYVVAGAMKSIEPLPYELDTEQCLRIPERAIVSECRILERN